MVGIGIVQYRPPGGRDPRSNQVHRTTNDAIQPSTRALYLRIYFPGPITHTYHLQAHNQFQALGTARRHQQVPRQRLVRAAARPLQAAQPRQRRQVPVRAHGLPQQAVRGRLRQHVAAAAELPRVVSAARRAGRGGRGRREGVAQR